MSCNVLFFITHYKLVFERVGRDLNKTICHYGYNGTHLVYLLGKSAPQTVAPMEGELPSVTLPLCEWPLNSTPHPLLRYQQPCLCLMNANDTTVNPDCS